MSQLEVTIGRSPEHAAGIGLWKFRTGRHNPIRPIDRNRVCVRIADFPPAIRMHTQENLSQIRCCSVFCVAQVLFHDLLRGVNCCDHENCLAAQLLSAVARFHEPLRGGRDLPPAEQNLRKQTGSSTPTF